MFELAIHALFRGPLLALNRNVSLHLTLAEVGCPYRSEQGNEVFRNSRLEMIQVRTLSRPRMILRRSAFRVKGRFLQSFPLHLNQ